MTTSFVLDISDLLNRVVALELEVMTLLLPSDKVCSAVPYFIYSQSSYPYFINRLGAGTSESVESMEFDADSYTVIMRLLIGPVTAGYVGDLESTLQSYVPAIKTYFNSRQSLQSASYPTAMVGINTARIINWTGLRLWPSNGTPNTLQMGTEFTLHCELDEEIVQAFA